MLDMRPGSRELRDRVTGVDLSNNNGPSINFAAIADAGHEFVVLKVSEGDLIDQTSTRERVRAIRRAGMIAGGYCFLRPRRGRSGAAEARIFWRRGREIGLWHDGKRRNAMDLRPVLDIEASAFDCSTRYGRWRTRRYIASAVRELRRLSGGHYPIIYAGHFYRDVLRCGRTFGCRLWYPEYGDRYDLWPKAWKHGPWIWQYTETGRCPGVPGKCDLNLYLGRDLRSFRRELCI